MKRTPFVFLLTLSLLFSGCNNSPKSDDGSSISSKVLSRIILGGNYPKTFNAGDTFSYSGLLVVAYYSDYSSKTVKNYTVSTPDMDELGEQDVVVTYQENNKTVHSSYTITIIQGPVVPDPDPDPDPKPLEDPKLTAISLSGQYKTTFKDNETFNYDGLVVTAYYDDGNSKTVTGFTVSTTLLGVDGGQVVISYKEGDITKFSSYTVVIEHELKTVFDEPYINRQYYLNHIGDIYSVWKSYRGKGVTVAVIDSAFDAYHEDFVDSNGQSKVLDTSAYFSYNGYSVIKKVGKSYVHDLSDSHGTFCAGVLGAANNSKGVIGVAPECKLLLLKVDKKPKSICEAFKYAADQGAKVVTISIGSYHNYDGDLINDGSDLSIVFDSAISYARNKGTVIVSAGGNGGYDNPTEYTFPGACTNVIGCGGLANNESGEIWEGSSYNSSPTYQFIDVFAPADNIFNICNYENSGKTVLYDGGWKGTSFASPIVAGLAALYFEKYPDHTPSQFENALFSSCHKIATSEIATSNQLGYGRVDAAKLLNIDNNYQVTLKVKSNWSNTYVYAWNSDLTLEKELHSWPGVAMSKNNGYFTYTINVKDYDSILFSDGDQNKSVNLLSSTFVDGHYYDLTSSLKENNLYVGSYKNN